MEPGGNDAVEQSPAHCSGSRYCLIRHPGVDRASDPSSATGRCLRHSRSGVPPGESLRAQNSVVAQTEPLPKILNPTSGGGSGRRSISSPWLSAQRGRRSGECPDNSSRSCGGWCWRLRKCGKGWQGALAARGRHPSRAAQDPSAKYIYSLTSACPRGENKAATVQPPTWGDRGSEGGFGRTGPSAQRSCGGWGGVGVVASGSC